MKSIKDLARVLELAALSVPSLASASVVATAYFWDPCQKASVAASLPGRAEAIVDLSNLNRSKKLTVEAVLQPVSGLGQELERVVRKTPSVPTTVATHSGFPLSPGLSRAEFGKSKLAGNKGRTRGSRDRSRRECSSCATKASASSPWKRPSPSAAGARPWS